MESFTMTGGARIGFANATWPFAKLRVDKNTLELKVQLLGNYVFGREDVISIEPFGLIPVIGRGIRINHRVGNYNKKIIFWTMGNAEAVIERIRATGFLNTGQAPVAEVHEEIRRKQATGGFPLKTAPLMAVVVAWNALILMDFIGKGFIGSGTMLAVILLAILSVMMLVSGGFRSLFLKEGRDLADIKAALIVILVISLFAMLVLVPLMP